MDLPGMKAPVSRREFLGNGLKSVAAVPLLSTEHATGDFAQPVHAERSRWIAYLKKVSEPVLTAVAAGRLHAVMPVEAVAGHEAERRVGSHLEAFARLLAGLAPWLESDDSEDVTEANLRARYRQLAQQGLANAVDPGSPDYMHFGESGQTLVDASFLSLALLRAPRQLLDGLSKTTRSQLLTALDKTRAVLPPFSNWLLFAALNELLRRRLDATWDRVRVDYALRELNAWYLGDGTYGDGPEFHADFYNSYVMHPYLLQIADVIGDTPWARFIGPIHARAARYAAIQERLIGPGGEFPVLGRSICYRGGAFHLLADIARRQRLPEPLQPAGVRAALGAVQARTLDARETFDANGWLRIGLAGHQPSLAETYISTGSLYLCSVLWLPLGLSASDPFWAAEAADWTQRRVWAGGDASADHALGKEA